MRHAIKLLGILAALVGTVYATNAIRRRLALRRLERDAEIARAVAGEGPEVFFVPVVEEAVIVEGISDLDAEGLSGMGEALEPDKNETSHRDTTEQRERIPRPPR